MIKNNALEYLIAYFLDTPTFHDDPDGARGAAEKVLGIAKEIVSENI